jgi:hypothetical protein
MFSRAATKSQYLCPPTFKQQDYHCPMPSSSPLPSAGAAVKLLLAIYNFPNAAIRWYRNSGINFVVLGQVLFSLTPVEVVSLMVSTYIGKSNAIGNTKEKGGSACEDEKVHFAESKCVRDEINENSLAMMFSVLQLTCILSSVFCRSVVSFLYSKGCGARLTKPLFSIYFMSMHFGSCR